MRSPRNITPSGRAKTGAVAESTEPTATPAYLRLATNRTELAAVTTLRIAIVTSGPRPALRIALPAVHVHGVHHSRADASGRRTARAGSGSISLSGTFIMAVDTAQATDATSAVHTPKAKRCGCESSDRTLTISATPPSVRNEQTMTGMREM